MQEVGPDSAWETKRLLFLSDKATHAAGERLNPFLLPRTVLQPSEDDKRLKVTIV
jgi:hypothetical protein